MTVLLVGDLREYFRDAVHSALANQHVEVDDHTEHYVVNLLTLFARSEALFEPGPSGPRLRPLALMLGEALEAPTPSERCRGLQRIGDVSLFVAGFFGRSFERKPVDIDYHIALGGQAYGTLAEEMGGGRKRPLAQVFAELAAKFQMLVDALNEISEVSYRHSAHDVLRLYEQWLKTGSRRAGQILDRLGVHPSTAARSTHTH